jgi:hypothetical protein
VTAATVARGLGVVRVGIGTGLLLAPGLAGRIWIGEHADGPGARLFARAVGVRDVVLGARALLSQQEGLPLRRWMRMEVAVDVGDAVVTVLAARHLTPGRRVVMPLIAGGYAAASWAAAASIDDGR